jgi:hypothetical protein
MGSGASTSAMREELRPKAGAAYAAKAKPPEAAPGD